MYYYEHVLHMYYYEQYDDFKQMKYFKTVGDE